MHAKMLFWVFMIWFLFFFNEGATAQQCSDGYVVPGLECGQFPGNHPCPAGTRCVLGPASRRGLCCRVKVNGKVTAKVKDAPTQHVTGGPTGKAASINNHCTSPLMHDGFLITCTPDQADRTCPTPCFTCMPLLGTFVGLCCEDRTNTGCGNPYAPRARSPDRVGSSYESATTPQPLYNKPRSLDDDVDVDAVKSNSYAPDKAYTHKYEDTRATTSTSDFTEHLDPPDSLYARGRKVVLGNNNYGDNTLDDEYLPNSKNTYGDNSGNVPILNGQHIPERMAIPNGILSAQNTQILKAKPTNQRTTLSKYANAIPTNLNGFPNKINTVQDSENIPHKFANMIHSDETPVNLPTNQQRRYIVSKFSNNIISSASDDKPMPIRQDAPPSKHFKNHKGDGTPILRIEQSREKQRTSGYRNDDNVEDVSLDIPTGILPDMNDIVILGELNYAQTTAGADMDKTYERNSISAENGQSSNHNIGYADTGEFVSRPPRPRGNEMYQQEASANEESPYTADSFSAPPRIDKTEVRTGGYTLQAEYTNTIEHSGVNSKHGPPAEQAYQTTTDSQPDQTRVNQRMDVDTGHNKASPKELPMKPGYEEQESVLHNQVSLEAVVNGKRTTRRRVVRPGQYVTDKFTLAPTPARNAAEPTAKTTVITNNLLKPDEKVKPTYERPVETNMQLQRDQNHLQTLSARKAILHIEILPNTREDINDTVSEPDSSPSYRAAPIPTVSPNSPESTNPLVSLVPQGYEQEEHRYASNQSNSNPSFSPETNMEQEPSIPVVNGYPVIPQIANVQSPSVNDAANNFPSVNNATSDFDASPPGLIQVQLVSSATGYPLRNSNNMLRNSSVSNNFNSGPATSSRRDNNSSITSSDNAPQQDNSNIIFTGPLTMDSIEHSITLLQQLGIADISPGYVQVPTHPNASNRLDRANVQNQISNAPDGRQIERSVERSSQESVPNGNNLRRNNGATSATNNPANGRRGFAAIRGGNPCGGPRPIALCLGPEYTQCGAGTRCVPVTSNIGVCCPNVPDVGEGSSARVTAPEVSPCGLSRPVSRCLGPMNVGCGPGSHCVRVGATSGVCCSDRRLIGSADVPTAPGLSAMPARAAPVAMPGSPIPPPPTSPAVAGSNPCGPGVSPRSVCGGPFNRQCDQTSRCVQVDARFGVCCPVRVGAGVRTATSLTSPSFRRLAPGLIPRRFARGNGMNLNRASRFMSGIVRGG